MLQTIIQYQPYIYAVFITIEVLRYMYNIYSSWRASRARARQYASTVEFFTEVYCTAANAILFKKFTPLNEKARLAFNNARLLGCDNVSESMWALFNRVLEQAFTDCHFLDKHLTADAVVCPIYDRAPRQSQPSQRFNPYSNNEYPTPMEPAPMEPVHVNDHPLQTPNPSPNESLNNSQSSAASIYEGMDLFNINQNDNTDQNDTSNTPNTSKTQKRPRFGLVSTSSMDIKAT